MAVLVACADGNFTTAATWAVSDATAYLDSQNSVTTLTTAYVESSAFTPGAITIDAIAVKIGQRIGTTGTISVRLAQGGATVAGTEVTVNCSDLPSCTSLTSSTVTSTGEGGWFLFKFAAPVLLIAATAYTVSAKTSNATQVSLYRNATANNWARVLRTTTTQAPAAGDDMIITKEWTAAATGTARVVTMDSTAATDYGSANTAETVAAIAITQGGTLTYGTTAATNYILRVSGHVIIYNGGTLSIGTTGTPIPRDSTAVLEMDCAADGGFGTITKNLAVANLQGLSRTSGKNVTWTKLTANMAAAATSASVAADTGWKSGDEVVFTPTTRTYNDFDRKTLNADAGASSLAWTGGTTFTHLGTAPLQGEAALLTRNVKYRSVSSSNMTFFFLGDTATVDCDWMEARYCGTQTTGKFSFESNGGGAGTWTFHNCSFYDFEVIAIIIRGNTGTWTVDNCVFFNIANSSFGTLWTENQGGQTMTITNNCVSPCAGAGFITWQNGQPTTGTVANNVVSGSFINMSFGGVFVTAKNIPATWSNNEFHGNRGQLQFSGQGRTSGGHYIKNWKIWHTSNVVTGGFYIGNSSGIIFDGCEAYGNNGANWQIDTATLTSIAFYSCTGGATTDFATTNNINVTTNTFNIADVQMKDCDFSVVAGVVAACTNDIQLTSGHFLGSCPIWGDNNFFGGTNVIANLSTGADLGMSNSLVYLRSQRHNQTDDDHRMFLPQGNIKTNASVFNSAAPSAELQPSSTTVKLKLPLPKIPIDDGTTIDVTVAVRKSAAYNGNAPRLMLRRKDSLGYSLDTVADTLSVGADTWEDLTYTTAAAIDDGMVEFYVDCDGTAGSVYVDDVRVA